MTERGLRVNALMAAVSGNSAPVSMDESALQKRRWRVCETEWQRFEFLD
jgi:hypothetical protein